MEGERQRQRENVSMSPSIASVWLSGLFLFLPTFVSLGLSLCPFLSSDSQFFFFPQGLLCDGLTQTMEFRGGHISLDWI